MARFDRAAHSQMERAPQSAAQAVNPMLYSSLGIICPWFNNGGHTSLGAGPMKVWSC